MSDSYGYGCVTQSSAGLQHLTWPIRFHLLHRGPATYQRFLKVQFEIDGYTRSAEEEEGESVCTRRDPSDSAYYCWRTSGGMIGSAVSSQMTWTMCGVTPALLRTLFFLEPASTHQGEYATHHSSLLLLFLPLPFIVTGRERVFR